MLLRTKASKRVVSSLDEYRAVVTEIAMRARRSLCIYTPDLEPMLYEQDAFLDALKRLVLARSHGRVRVLILDPAGAARDGRRFMQMARRLTSSINLRTVPAEHRANPCAFISADGKAIAFRPDAAEWTGYVEFNDDGIDRTPIDYFEEVWSGSLVQPQLQPAAFDWSR